MTCKIPEDFKDWSALSCPLTGLRFDRRTLEFIDTDHDGRIRAEEVRAAVAFLADEKNNPGKIDLGADDAALEALLEANLSRQADLTKLEPNAEERKALAEWEAAGRTHEVACVGEATAEAEAKLSAVEPVIDAFFTPPADMPLVTDAPDVELPLEGHLNPKHLEAILAFAEACVNPVLGPRTALTRLDWKAVKTAFAPYRAWVRAKPVMNATAKDTLVAEEKLLRLRLNLPEFLVNFVTMDALYGMTPEKVPAIFQTGVLRIDGKEIRLCFHVESEGAHAALAGRSKCCVVYAKLTRPGEAATRQICAVVTAGRVAGLYVGRNGIFCDRDGKDWEAVVTKVVEAEVSLAESFWSPWRKLGESVAGMAKKFLGDKQAKSTALVTAPTADVSKEGGAAMASSVAAIGIGLGMLGTAAAALMAALSSMNAFEIVGSVVALVLVISLPSVILTWFNLRKRDLGAILNASGWAINRPLRFSMKLARSFTVCAKGPSFWPFALAIVVAILALGVGNWYYMVKFAARCENAEPKVTEVAEHA